MASTENTSIVDRISQKNPSITGVLESSSLIYSSSVNQVPANVILTEDGYPILTEDGNYILLE